MEKKLEFKLKSLRFFIIFLVLTLILTSYPYIYPDKAEAVTLQELASRISQLNSEEEQLLSEVLAAETQISQKEGEVISLQGKLDNFEEELKELYKKQREVERNINKLQEELEENAVKSYKYSNNRVARMLISAKSLNEVSKVLYIYRRMIRTNQELMSDLEEEKNTYEMIFRKSEDTKNNIKITKENIIIEKEALEIYLANKEVLLQQVKSEKSEFTSLLAEIKERIRQIQPAGLTLVGEWDMVATAYFSGGGGLSGNGITAIGLRARKGIVAVDPRVIPLGTKLYIPGYGEALAADTGGWVKGNRIDLVFESLEECYRFGRRRLKVYLVES
ncbi:MAG: 3D domain-containing protein [Actinomycetota bacterium]|nr:3D domain-containing protein [Actinomycetota bacterium]